MIYMIEIIGIPPHTTLLYKIEILKSIVYYLNVSFKKNINSWKGELDTRGVVFPGCVQSTILSNLYEFLAHIRSEK